MPLKERVACIEEENKLALRSLEDFTAMRDLLESCIICVLYAIETYYKGGVCQKTHLAIMTGEIPSIGISPELITETNVLCIPLDAKSEWILVYYPECRPRVKNERWRLAYATENAHCYLVSPFSPEAFPYERLISKGILLDTLLKWVEELIKFCQRASARNDEFQSRLETLERNLQNLP